jgi:hypothetical protein
MINKIKSFLFYLRGFWFFNEKRKLKNAEVLFFCHDFTRNYIYNNLKYSSLVDTINEYLIQAHFSTITIARPYSKIPVDESFGRVYKVNGGFARSRFYDLICDKIYFLLPIKIKKNYFQIRFWTSILKIVNPKVIIGIEPLWELCYAASTNKIIVFDIQHGMIEGPPMAHFYKMTYRPKTQEGWPNFIICRNINDFQWLCNTRSIFTIPLLIGHPWLARFIDNNDKLVQQISDENVFKFNKPIILISLQHLRDTNGLPNSFTQIPISLKEIMKSKFGSNYMWLIRLHPILLSESIYSRVCEYLNTNFGIMNNIEWVEASKLPLPYILSKTSLHFTRNSSTTIEAAVFGIKTGILDIKENTIELQKLFRYEIKNKIVSILPINDISIISNFIKDTTSLKTNINQEFGLIKQKNNIKELINYISIYLKSEKNYYNFIDFLNFKFGFNSKFYQKNKIYNE